MGKDINELLREYEADPEDRLVKEQLLRDLIRTRQLKFGKASIKGFKVTDKYVKIKLYGDNLYRENTTYFLVSGQPVFVFIDDYILPFTSINRGDSFFVRWKARGRGNHPWSAWHTYSSLEGASEAIQTGAQGLYPNHKSELETFSVSIYNELTDENYEFVKDNFPGDFDWVMRLMNNEPDQFYRTQLESSIPFHKLFIPNNFMPYFIIRDSHGYDEKYIESKLDEVHKLENL